MQNFCGYNEKELYDMADELIDGLNNVKNVKSKAKRFFLYIENGKILMIDNLRGFDEETKSFIEQFPIFVCGCDFEVSGLYEMIEAILIDDFETKYTLQKKYETEKEEHEKDLELHENYKSHVESFGEINFRPWSEIR